MTEQRKQKTPDPNLLARLLNRIMLALRLLVDRRVNITTKFVPFIGLLYLFWPIDIIPDFFVGIGQLDDIGIVLLALESFIRLAPQGVVKEHLARMQGQLMPEREEMDGQPNKARPYNPDEEVIDADYVIR